MICDAKQLKDKIKSGILVYPCRGGSYKEKDNWKNANIKCPPVGIILKVGKYVPEEGMDCIISGLLGDRNTDDANVCFDELRNVAFLPYINFSACQVVFGGN